jgi:hypothetical protein
MVAGLCPKPRWLEITAMFSALGEGGSRQARQETMPSNRE